MEISAVIADAIAVQGPVISRFILPRHSPTLSILAISAAVSLPVDSLPPPAAVRSDPYRHAPRALARRTRRTRRRSVTEDGGEDGFSGDGDGDDGPFGGGGDGGGGGWGSGGRGGPDWEASGPPSSSDPAFDFLYEIMCWVALSNCAHFAAKKLGRLLSSRGKVVPLRLVPPIC